MPKPRAMNLAPYRAYFRYCIEVGNNTWVTSRNVAAMMGATWHTTQLALARLTSQGELERRMVSREWLFRALPGALVVEEGHHFDLATPGMSARPLADCWGGYTYKRA